MCLKIAGNLCAAALLLHNNHHFLRCCLYAFDVLVSGKRRLQECVLGKPARLTKSSGTSSSSCLKRRAQQNTPVSGVANGDFVHQTWVNKFNIFPHAAQQVAKHVCTVHRGALLSVLRTCSMNKQLCLQTTMHCKNRQAQYDARKLSNFKKLSKIRTKDGQIQTRFIRNVQYHTTERTPSSQKVWAIDGQKKTSSPCSSNRRS